jgi:hypothetical protein
MKKILVLLIIISSVIGFQSCKEFLVPEVKTDIVLTNYGNTTTEASLILTQAYSELRDDYVTGSIFWTRFTTDYSVPPAGTSLALSLIARLSYDATEGDVFNIWTAHYRAVSRANFVIGKADENLAKGTALPASDITAWTKLSGEARFIRAFLYFNLVRLYRNTPIIDKFFTDVKDIANVSNAPADKMKDQENKVYDFVIADLNKAIEQLAASVERGRASKLAAQSLLAKVYLNRATIEKYRDQSGDGKAHYENALVNLNAVINSKAFALKTYYPDNFIRDKQHTGANEAIFMLEFNELDNAGGRVGLSSGYLNNSSSNVEIGTLAGANGGMQATDFGWSVFDFNSKGDWVRRFWSFEEGEFRSYNVNGITGFQNTAADCPDGANCEIFLRTSEPYQFTRPYWFEIVNDANAFRFNPTTADVATDAASGKSWFTTIWGGGLTNNNPGMRLVKYRRNPVTQPNYSQATWDADLPVMRYAEVLLMYAEVANELVGPNAAPTGNTLTALQAVNQIRNRARNFTYYPNLTTASRIIATGPYTATYGQIFSRKAKVGSTPAPATTDNAADTLAKYYNEICTFRGLRETPAAPDIRNYKDFPATANYVPDFASTLTKDQFREELLDERWRELAGEQNLRWYDLTRYGRLVNRVVQYKTLINPLTGRTLTATPFGTSVLLNPNPKFEYLPIPQSEINRNGKLNQNAGF